MARKANPRITDTVHLAISLYVKANNGMTPTVRELARLSGYASQTVSNHLRILAAQGKITLLTSSHRNIRMVQMEKTNA